MAKYSLFKVIYTDRRGDGRGVPTSMTAALWLWCGVKVSASPPVFIVRFTVFAWVPSQWKWAISLHFYFCQTICAGDELCFLPSRSDTDPHEDPLRSIYYWQNMYWGRGAIRCILPVAELDNFKREYMTEKPLFSCVFMGSSLYNDTDRCFEYKNGAPWTSLGRYNSCLNCDISNPKSGAAVLLDVISVS